MADDREARAQRLLADADLRIEVVRREINQNALAGMRSEITEYAAALVLAALDGLDKHLSDRDAHDLERARRGYCLMHDPDAMGYMHTCGFHWHGKNGTDVPVKDNQPVCPRCELKQTEAAIARVRAISRLPHFSQQDGVQGRAYTRGWESVISALDAALDDPAPTTEET